jgi:hypothetical protein
MLIIQQSSEGLPPIPKKTTQRCRNSATSRPSVATTAPGARFANAFSSAKANCLARCALEEASASPRGNVTIVCSREAYQSLGMVQEWCNTRDAHPQVHCWPGARAASFSAPFHTSGYCMQKGVQILSCTMH